MPNGVIPTANQPLSTVAPRQSIPFVDPKTGNLSSTGMQVLQQLYGLVNGMNRIIPCNCTNVGNSYTLTFLPIAPVYKQYSSYDTFAFEASGTNTAASTAQVVTNSGTLARLSILNLSGAPVGAGAISLNVQYFVTFADGYGPAFVIR